METRDLVNFCQAQGASEACTSLVAALEANGCTPDETYGYGHRETRAVNADPSLRHSDNPITRYRYTPHESPGTAGYCEAQAFLRS